MRITVPESAWMRSTGYCRGTESLDGGTVADLTCSSARRRQMSPAYEDVISAVSRASSTVARVRLLRSRRLSLHRLPCE